MTPPNEDIYDDGLSTPIEPNAENASDTTSDAPWEEAAAEPQAEVATEEPVDEPDASQFEETMQFVMNWNRLVSMTNWEKGRIISQWRGALVASGAPVQVYSDEAWAQVVGNVSSQHAGRLRRVFDRFGEPHENYPSLYWSHFQAGLDWDDAEMWLEGAVQSGWSVAQMRSSRWEAMGAPADKRPKDADIIMAELDEDVNPSDDSNSAPQSSGDVQDIDDRLEGGGDGQAFDADGSIEGGMSSFPDDFQDTDMEGLDQIQPFQGFPDMPEDLTEAFEAAKIAVLNHKLTDWRDVKPDVVLAAVNGLKALILAGK